MRRLSPFLALPLALAACASEEAPDRSGPSNVLLITLDTTRADALTCLGAPDGVTPNLDALAAEGVLYEAARTVTPITLPSHASMLTGLYPPRHTVRVNSANALPASASTLAELASERGIQTAAFIASIVLASDFGLAQGFEVYDQPPPPPPGIGMPGQVGRRPATEIANAFKSWFWGRDAAEPFLAWVHLYDPHLPYDVENPFRKSIPGDGYLAEVAAADHAVGEILDALGQKGLLEDTLIVVVGDHGEGRGQHGERSHSALIYESTMRVPMIVRHHDGYRAGERSSEIVSIVDVFPTAAEALGLPLGEAIDGTSLFNARAPEGRGVYMESLYGLYSFEWSALAGWADVKSKYIHASVPELYEVAQDPDEERDVVQQGAERLPRYLAQIEAVMAAPALERDAGDIAGALMAEQLQGLGYTGTAPNAEDEPDAPFAADRPSPVTRMDAWRAFISTEDLTTFEANQRAEDALLRIVEENPRNHSAWLQLSVVYLNVRLYPEAEEAARKSVAIGGDRYPALNNIALALDAQERYAEAVPFYERAIELAPGLTQSLQRLIEIHGFLGNSERALELDALMRQAR